MSSIQLLAARKWRHLGTLGIVGLVSCGGGETTPVTEPSVVGVAAVVLGRDTASLVIGASVTLTASARDAGGNPMSRQVAWSTSDASRATVSSQGVVTGVGLGTAVIMATVDSRTATATITVKEGGMVTSGGATLVALAGAATLTVPAGAVTTPTMITIEGAAGPPDARVIPQTTVDLGPSGVTFAQPVTLRLRYDPARLPAGPPERLLTVQRAVGLGWQEVVGSEVEPTSRSVRATLTSFSRYGILSAPFVTGVSVTPNGGTLLPGQTLQLSATPRAAGGEALGGRDVVWASATPATATVSPTGLVTAVSAGGPVPITATVEGVAAGVFVTVSLPPVASVMVTPSTGTVRVGEALVLTSTERDAAGNVLTGRARAWTTSNPGVATVSQAGVVTGVGIGSATITATSEGRSGSATITVTQVPVASVAVTPSAATLTVGGTQALTVTLRDASGNVLAGRGVAWSTSNASVATVSQTGTVTALGVGSATITATSEGVPGAATITVATVPVASVTVTPSTATLTIGANQALAATLRDASGNVLAGRAVAWSSSNAAVATVNQTGVVTAIGTGSATVTATSEGVLGTAIITVTTVPVASVSVTPASGSLVVGATLALTATPRDASGNLLAGRVIVWSSSNASVATVSQGGVVTAIGAGSATIIATSEGVTGSAAVVVTPVPVASVSVTPPTATLIVGATQALVATPRDASGNPLTGRVVTWSSSNTSVVTVSASGLVTAVAVGSAAITATVEGVQGSAGVTVSQVPVASVTVSPGTFTLQVGAALLIASTERDANGNVLTNRTRTWSSSNTAVATVSAAGWVTGVAQGTATITATSEGISGSATATITSTGATMTLTQSTVTATGTQLGGYPTVSPAGFTANLSAAGLLNTVSLGPVQYGPGAAGWMKPPRIVFPGAQTVGIQLFITPTTLPSGSYTAAFDVISTATTNGPQRATVTLVVSPPVNPCSGHTPASIGMNQTIALTFVATDCQYSASQLARDFTFSLATTTDVLLDGGGGLSPGVQLYDNAGTFIDNGWMSSFQQPYSLSRRLSPGTYRVRALGSVASSPYSLRLATSPIAIPNDGLWRGSTPLGNAVSFRIHQGLLAWAFIDMGELKSFTNSCWIGAEMQTTAGASTAGGVFSLSSWNAGGASTTMSGSVSGSNASGSFGPISLQGFTCPVASNVKWTGTLPGSSWTAVRF